MKHGSLFSGIGGFDLAAEWMGWENDFIKFCLSEYGLEYRPKLNERMQRVEAYGSSSFDDTNGIEHYFEFNYAGEDGTSLDKEGILNRYCRSNSKKSIA